MGCVPPQFAVPVAGCALSSEFYFAFWARSSRSPRRSLVWWPEWSRFFWSRSTVRSERQRLSLCRTHSLARASLCGDSARQESESGGEGVRGLLYRSLTYEATRSTLTRAVLLKAQPARPWGPSWAWAHRAAAEGSWPDGTASLGAPAPWLSARRRHPVARARASLSGATRSGHRLESAQHGAPGGWWPA